MDQRFIAPELQYQGLSVPGLEVLQACDFGICLVGLDARLLFANHWMESAAGMDRGAWLGRTLDELFPGECGPRLLNSLQDALTRGMSSRLSTKFHPHPLPLYASAEARREGRPMFQQVSLVPLPGDSSCCLLQVNDVTAAVERDRQLLLQHEEAQERATHTRAILHSIADGVITTDAEGRIDYFNPVARELTGWSPQTAMGRPLEEVFRLSHEAGRQPLNDPVHHCLKNGELHSKPGEEPVLLHLSGAGVPVEYTLAPIRAADEQVRGVVAVFRDVTSARKLAAQVSWQAAHDALTGLANRASFDHALELLIGGARQDGRQHCLMYLDLDQFKIVNDTCGHVAGDELLRQVSSLLASQVRGGDLLARLGGDEFGLLLADCPVESAERIAGQILQAINDYRFGWGDNIFAIGVSIGMVEIGRECEGVAQVMSAADTACYTAKDTGRNRFHRYQSGEGEAAQRQGEMQWVTRIQRALEEDRFRLYVQSIVPVGVAGAVSHYEVLIRMLDEQGGLVPPGAFIPSAERFNLMPAVDRWVVRRVFSLIQENRERLVGGGYRFAINLSGGSVNDPGTLKEIGEQLARCEIPEGMISFEITETTAISNLSTASYFIRTLKQAGCHFSLDDFGSGLSSFAYLKNLPVDYLKIDGAFVKDLADDPIDRAMVQAINQIGHVMNLKTIAEFVENDAIMQRLGDIGVDYAQGYGVSKPTPLVDEQGRLLLD